MNTSQHTQHTAGPWSPVFKSDRKVWVVGNLATDMPVATVVNRYAEREIEEANAWLIASAPELLAALTQAVAAFDYAVAAMAKGQTVSISSLQNCAANARSAISKALA